MKCECDMSEKRGTIWFFFLLRVCVLLGAVITCLHCGAICDVYDRLLFII